MGCVSGEGDFKGIRVAFLEEVIPVRQMKVNCRNWSLFLAFSFS